MTTHTPPPPRLLSFLLVLLSPLLMQAQTLVNQLWKERTGHPTKAFDFMSATRGKSVNGSKGSADNVYVLGSTYHIGEEENAIVYKYTITGSLVWTYEYNSVSDYRDFGTDIYCKNGYVYVTGVSWDSINNYSEIVVLALDETDGTEAWRTVYTPSYGGYAVPAGIQVDGNQNVYVAGTEQTDSAEFALITIGFSDGGNQEWVTVYDSVGMYDGGVAIKIFESNGDTLVKVTGYSGTAFGSWDFVSLNIDDKGNLLSTARHTNGNGNFSYPVDLTTDYGGNLYVLGTIGLSATNRDWKLIKYDTLFNEVWVKTYGSADSLFDEPSGIVADHGGQLLLTGYTSTTNGSNLATTVRYNTNGNITWQKHIASPVAGENAKAKDIVLPPVPNTDFYICGSSYHQGDDDFFTAKYDINGNLKWLKYFNDSTASEDEAQDIQVMEDGYILTSGISTQDSVKRYVSVAYKEADFFIPTEADSPSTAYAFYENRGQILVNDSTGADSVFYYTNAGSPQLYIGHRRLSYVLASSDSAGLTDTVYRIDFTIGSAPINNRENIFEDKKSESFLNYFLGQLPGPVTKVQGYNRLVQKEVIRDIDWHLYATTAGIKNYLVVKPNTSTANLKIKYTGADSISITNKRLTLHTAIGNLTLDSLVAFTVNSSGVRTSVTVNYVYDSIALDKFKFSFGSYTASEHLVVSWKMGAAQGGTSNGNLEWSTYYGGSLDDYALDVKTDAQSNVYVVGGTKSLFDFPVGPSYPATNGFVSFVSCFNQGGTLKWRTLFGGATYSEAKKIAVNYQNELFIIGSTRDTEVPSTSSLPLPAYRTPTGLYSVTSNKSYICRISNFNSGIINWYEYYTGTQNDITFDANNNLYMVGLSNGDYWTRVESQTATITPYYFNFIAIGSAMITKFNSSLEVIWSEHAGHSSFNAIATDNTKVYVVGTSASITGLNNVMMTPLNTQGVHTQAYSGNNDGLLLEFDMNDNWLYGTFIGGQYLDDLVSLDVENGKAYICGWTQSDDMHQFFNSLYPGTTAPVNHRGTPYNGGQFQPADGVFMVWDGITDNLVYFSYVGGNGDDVPRDIYVKNGTAFLTGSTSSSDLGNALPSGYFTQSSLSGSQDGFILMYNSLDQLWSTYIGGNKEDKPNALTVDIDNHLYIVGQTKSAQDVNNLNNGYPLFDPSPASPTEYFQELLNLQSSSATQQFYDCFISKFDVAQIVGLDEYYMNDETILVYPNPTSNEVYIDNIVFNVITISNSIGQAVFKSNEYQKSVDVLNLPRGMYFISVVTDNGRLTAKFVKQ